jgi:nitrogen fixation/metabolism regulation signal transduction histidine kinase
MSHKTGNEMRKLIIAITCSTLVLVVAIIAYFMADAIVTANKNIESDKQKMVEQSVGALNEMSELANVTNIGPEMLQLFNPEILQRVMAGDMEFLYQTAANMVMSFYQVVAYKSRGNESIDVKEMPANPPQGNYETLNKLGNKEGFFVSVFTPIDLSMIGLKGTMYVNIIADRTEELASINEYFSNQRNSMIWRLSIAALITIILSILLTTLGLRYFTEKYVVKPIEEINQTAEAIMDGSFEGEAKYDENSSYAALQGLLRSGQRVLQKMDEEMKE